MKPIEVTDLTTAYPMLCTALRMISGGKIINKDDPMWPTYLLIRQRGLVERTGDKGKIINVSHRGLEFLEMARKR